MHDNWVKKKIGLRWLVIMVSRIWLIYYLLILQLPLQSCSCLLLLITWLNSIIVCLFCVGVSIVEGYLHLHVYSLLRWSHGLPLLPRWGISCESVRCLHADYAAGPVGNANLPLWSKDSCLPAKFHQNFANETAEVPKGDNSSCEVICMLYVC